MRLILDDNAEQDGQDMDRWEKKGEEKIAWQPGIKFWGFSVV